LVTPTLLLHLHLRLLLLLLPPLLHLHLVLLLHLLRLLQDQLCPSFLLRVCVLLTSWLTSRLTS
jgi:hypothetical protein